MEVSDMNTIPQVSTSPRGSNLTADSDQVKALVVGAGLMDFGGDQSHSPKEALDQTAEVSEKTKALERLGAQIGKLFDFMTGKKNIHHEAKAMVAAVKTAYNRLQKLEVATWLVQETQTTPSLTMRDKKSSVEGDMTTPIARRDHNKKRKERTPPSQERKTAKRKKEKVRDMKKTPPVAKERRPGGRPEPLKDLKPRKLAKHGDERNRTQKQNSSQQGQEWVEVRRKARKPRSKSTMPNALVVQPKEGLSYAEALNKIKKDPNLKEVAKKSQKIRRTTAGGILIVLDGTSPTETAEIRLSIGEALGQEAVVTSRVQETQLEIKDLDGTTTKEEICDSLVQELGVDLESLNDPIKSIRKAYGGTQTAVARLTADLAKKLIEAGKLRIGWVVCRVRELLKPTKCFKCWQYGHLARNCKGEVDRTKCCMKCGNTGHKIGECKLEPHCVLCNGKGNKSCSHIAGSSRCPVYTQALQEYTRKRR